MTRDPLLISSDTVLQSAKPHLNPSIRSGGDDEGDDPVDPTTTASTAPTQFADLPDDVLYEIASHLPKTQSEALGDLWDRVKRRFHGRTKEGTDYSFPSPTTPVLNPDRSILALASVNKRFRHVLFPSSLIRSRAILPTRAHGVLLEGLSENLRTHVR
jgi:hypothetical protein